jgi:hypothetical protein
LPTPEQIIESWFPNLSQPNTYKITSPQTEDYNCIAWSAEVTNACWWPETDASWPTTLPLVNTLDNFIAAFRMLGYEPCPTFVLESGYQKVAIYLDRNGSPTHMARQLSSGAWTSKLGPSWDIEHTELRGVEDSTYGHAKVALRKRI